MTALGDQLRALLPPEAYNLNAAKLAAVLEAEAAALAAATLSTNQVLSAILPDGGNGLADWERVLSLPDPCLVDV
ncbi:phage tail protein, partial [Pseudomonas sp. HMWF031]